MKAVRSGFCFRSGLSYSDYCFGNKTNSGKIEYRLDKSNIIHVPIGKASFTEEQLSDNFQTLIGAIVKARPSTLKGQYLKSVVIAPTMGPGVKINPIKLA